MKQLAARPFATAGAMPAARASNPVAVIYKVMGKMFAILALRGDESLILKCDPNLARALKQRYKGVGHRSHLDKRFWISVTLDADVPAKELQGLIGHSYALVCSGLTRKQQAELSASSRSK